MQMLSCTQSETERKQSAGLNNEDLAPAAADTCADFSGAVEKLE